MPFYAVIWPFILWCNQTIFWVHFTVGGDNQNELIKARFNFVIFKFYKRGVNSFTDMPTWIIFLKISILLKSFIKYKLKYWTIHNMIWKLFPTHYSYRLRTFTPFYKIKLFLYKCLERLDLRIRKGLIMTLLNNATYLY